MKRKLFYLIFTLALIIISFFSIKSFTNRVGSAPIQRIAKEVAEGMAEHVPIRFTGDKGWYGYAR